MDIQKYPYRSTKYYPHSLGLSACFRQWRATHSHCRFLHGYALAFKFEFAAMHLDDKNWVADFGGLKKLKERLVNTFDHKLVVAGDDPEKNNLLALHDLGLADVLILPGGVGCEKFAELAYFMAQDVLYNETGQHRIKVVYCECSEHEGNSAIFRGNI